MFTFKDRRDAAEQLAGLLEPLKLERPLILAIPRGAVPMARLLAERLDGDLDVVLVRKLGAPGNPEYAIGAIGESGEVHLAEDAVANYGEDYLQRAAKEQLQLLRQRRSAYAAVRRPLCPSGRDVVVVDDGSATGATMAAALAVVRPRDPARLVAALGVAPPDVVRRLRRLADQVVCVHTPTVFYAVGQFFRDFGQVSDEEVVRHLREFYSERGVDRR